MYFLVQVVNTLAGRRARITGIRLKGGGSSSKKRFELFRIFVLCRYELRSDLWAYSIQTSGYVQLYYCIRGTQTVTVVGTYIQSCDLLVDGHNLLMLLQDCKRI